MLRFLRQLSGACFYLLGASFFGAYVLLHNSLWVPQMSAWLQLMDWPLIASAVVYGGLCVYLSLHTRP